MTLNENFIEFISLLNEYKVKYVLVGGWAVIFEGYSRTTDDMDILVEVSIENAGQILNVLKDFWGSTIGFSKEDFTTPDNVIMMGRPPFRIDILTSISGVDFKEAYSSSKIYSDEGVDIRCIHVNELIRNKKASGRLKDLADAEILEKIFKEKKKMSVTFSQEKLQKVNELISHYPQGKQKSALLPLLHIAQQEFDNWLDVPVMDYVAELLQIEPIEVYEVATFYSMYNLKPVGKYMFEVCQTGPCMLNGSDDIIEYIGEKLGIKPGETTKDGLFSLKTVECLGACGYAPMMQFGKYYREHLTKEKVDQLIEECRAKSNSLN